MSIMDGYEDPATTRAQYRGFYVGALILVLAVAWGITAIVMGIHEGMTPSSDPTPAATVNYNDPDALAHDITTEMRSRADAQHLQLTIDAVKCLPAGQDRTFTCMATTSAGNIGSTVTVSQDGLSYISKADK